MKKERLKENTSFFLVLGINFTCQNAVKPPLINEIIY